MKPRLRELMDAFSELMVTEGKTSLFDRAESQCEKSFAKP